MVTLGERLSKLEGAYEQFAILAARVDLLPTRDEMQAEIRAHDAETQTKFSEIQARFAEIRALFADVQTQFAGVQTQFAEVRAMIEERENRMIKWMVGLIAAQTGLTIGAISAAAAIIKLA